MKKEEIKIGLQATLAEHVWKKIGFGSAPRLYITNYWYEPSVIHNKDKSKKFEFIKTVALGMYPKGGISWFGNPEDVILEWPKVKEQGENEKVDI